MDQNTQSLGEENSILLDLSCVSMMIHSGNAYWIGLTGLSITDMNAAFADIAKAGGTTVRTW